MKTTSITFAALFCAMILCVSSVQAQSVQTFYPEKTDGVVTLSGYYNRGELRESLRAGFFVESDAGYFCTETQSITDLTGNVFQKISLPVGSYRVYTFLVSETETLFVNERDIISFIVTDDDSSETAQN